MSAIALVACGSGSKLTPQTVAKRFREKTGIALAVVSAHHGEKGHEEEQEVFLDPKRLTPAQVVRYGRFRLMFWPSNPVSDRVWNHDYRGFTYQTTYGDVSLLWNAGRRRQLDARWRRLDAVVSEVAG